MFQIGLLKGFVCGAPWLQARARSIVPLFLTLLFGGGCRATIQACQTTFDVCHMTIHACLSFGVHSAMCFHCEEGKGIHPLAQFSGICGMGLLMAMRKNHSLVPQHFFGLKTLSKNHLLVTR